MKWTILARSNNGLIVSNGAQQYDVPLDSKYISRLDDVWGDNNCIGKSFECDTSDPKVALDVQAGAHKFFIMMMVGAAAIVLLLVGGLVAALYFAYMFIIAGNVLAVIKIVVALLVFIAVIGGLFGRRREDYGPRNSP